MNTSEVLKTRLDDEELETILAIAKNQQSGRIAASEVRELVSAYRTHADLYEALTALLVQASQATIDRGLTALAKARGEVSQ